MFIWCWQRWVSWSACAALLNSVWSLLLMTLCGSESTWINLWISGVFVHRCFPANAGLMCGIQNNLWQDRNGNIGQDGRICLCFSLLNNADITIGDGPVEVWWWLALVHSRVLCQFCGYLFWEFNSVTSKLTLTFTHTHIPVLIYIERERECIIYNI